MSIGEVRPSEQGIFNELYEELVRGRKGVLVMIGRMYLDDSKDSSQQTAVVSAGLLGNREQWNTLWKLWDERLAKDELAYFKTTDCRHLRGEFQKFRKLGDFPVSDSRHPGRFIAQDVRNDLDEIVRSAGLVALGVAIAMPDWNDLVNLPGSCGFFARDPYETAMQSVIFESVKLIRRGNNVIVLYHDEGDDFPRLPAAYKDFKVKNKRLAKYLVGFDPRYDKVTPPLQAADLVANMALEVASAWVNKRQLDDLAKLRNRIPTVLIWDKEELLNLYARHCRKKKLRVE